MTAYVIRGAHTSYKDSVGYHAADETHCPRVSMLRSLGFNRSTSKTSEFTFALGLASEKLFEKDFPQAERDVAVEFKLSANVMFQGHADGKIEDTVYELKSISSTRTAEKVVLDGEYKEGHLMQLLGYMVAMEKSKGVLRYTSYVYHSKTKNKLNVKMEPCHVEFPVFIQDNGGIVVGTKKLDVTLHDIANSLFSLAECLEEQTLPPRPVEADDSFGPCFFCSLKEACKTISSVVELTNAAKASGFVEGA